MRGRLACAGVGPGLKVATSLAPPIIPIKEGLMGLAHRCHDREILLWAAKSLWHRERIS